MDRLWKQVHKILPFCILTYQSLQHRIKHFLLFGGIGTCTLFSFLWKVTFLVSLLSFTIVVTLTVSETSQVLSWLDVLKSVSNLKPGHAAILHLQTPYIFSLSGLFLTYTISWYAYHMNKKIKHDVIFIVSSMRELGL